jgi:tetratricopeptide (TPR) repeat protein
MPDATRDSDDLRAAIALIRGGHPERAIPLLDRLIESDPTCILALRERGYAKSFHGDPDGAVADFTTLIGRRTADPAGFTGRAAARERAGDRPGAIADYSAAIALDPRHPFAFLQRGRLRAQAGDVLGAVADFTADMEYSRTGPLSGLLNRGPARHRLGDVQGAIADLTEAMRLEGPPPVFAPLFRGRVLLAAGDYPGAIADFTAAIEAFPGLTNAYRQRAEAKARAGDPAGAEEDRRSYEQFGGRDLPAYE